MSIAWEAEVETAAATAAAAYRVTEGLRKFPASFPTCMSGVPPSFTSVLKAPADFSLAGFHKSTFDLFPAAPYEVVQGGYTISMKSFCSYIPIIICNLYDGR